MTNKPLVIYYKEQRDLLAQYLLNNVGVSKARVARILGVSRQAVNIQFPTKKGAK